MLASIPISSKFDKGSMRLWAISDIHLSFKSNREEFAKLQPREPDDGLILAGDSTAPSLSPT